VFRTNTGILDLRYEELNDFYLQKKRITYSIQLKTYTFFYFQEGEGTVPYDGFDMMSGGNEYDISHIAAASKW
jgi:hypothetical protein